MSLGEEFRELNRHAPRAMLVLFFAVVVALIFRDTLAIVGVLLAGLAFWVAVLFALLALPALIGATAGHTIGSVIGWLRARVIRR